MNGNMGDRQKAWVKCISEPAIEYHKALTRTAIWWGILLILLLILMTVMPSCK